MRVITELVVHTAAARGDQTVEEIRAWHLARGWDDIGYHWLVRKDGEICPGRPMEREGAHVYGHNRETVGICFAGHGDFEVWTPEQVSSWKVLAGRLLTQFRLKAWDVLGHREYPRVTKTCPGKLISMVTIRELADEGLGEIAGAVTSA